MCVGVCVLRDLWGEKRKKMSVLKQSSNVWRELDCLGERIGLYILILSLSPTIIIKVCRIKGDSTHTACLRLET